MEIAYCGVHVQREEGEAKQTEHITLQTHILPTEQYTTSDPTTPQPNRKTT